MPVLYLYQYPALYDGGLCREQCNIAYSRPAKSKWRLYRRPSSSASLQIVCRNGPYSCGSRLYNRRTGTNDQRRKVVGEWYKSKTRNHQSRELYAFDEIRTPCKAIPK